jgi:hypothetical protein
VINLFLGAALVAAPFFFKLAPHTAHTLSQEYFFILVTMLGALFFGIKETHRNFKIIAISLFVLAFMTVNPYGLYQYYQLCLCITGAVFMATIYSYQSEINYKFIGSCLGIVCILESVFLLFQYNGIDPHTEWFNLIGFNYKVITPTSRFVSGSLGNINHSAALIACTLPFLRPRFWLLPITVLLIVNSTMPVITALIAIFCLYSYKSKNYLFIITGFVALMLGAASLLLGLIPKASYFSDSHRIMAWKELWRLLGFQVTGQGFGYIPEIFSKILFPKVGRFYQIHNEWIELYAIGGLLAVGVGIYLIVPVFKNKGNAEINACLIALLVNSLGNFTFHIAPLFMIFGTCYALQLTKDK